MSLIRKLAACLLLIAVAIATVGCEDQGSAPPKKPADSSAKQDNPNKKKVDENDKPRLEEQYGFTSQQVGP